MRMMMMMMMMMMMIMMMSIHGFVLSFAIFGNRSLMLVLSTSSFSKVLGLGVS